MRQRPRHAIAVWAIGLATGSGCAHVEAPPGGPDDRDPPEVLTMRPEGGAVVQGFDAPVVFVFDERISEQAIEDAVSVSPRTSPVEVRHGRDEIRVSLRRGWEAGTIYQVEIDRTVRDLFNNQLARPIRLVFSTGPEIPPTALSGTVVDRIEGTPQAGIRIEAIRTDSLVYAAASDSTGSFRIEQFPEGDYLVRGFRDINRNRALDAFEARDSTEVTVATGAEPDVQLRIVEPDSTPPAPGSATVREGLVRIEFDDYLDPGQEMEGVTVAVTGGGSVLPIGSVSIGEPPAVVADTVQAPLGAAAPTSGRASRTLVARLGEGADLVAGTEYTVGVAGVRNIVGLEGGGDVTLTVPEPDP